MAFRNILSLAVVAFGSLSASPISAPNNCTACAVNVDPPPGTVTAGHNSQVTVALVAISSGSCLPKAQVGGGIECKRKSPCKVEAQWSWNFGDLVPDQDGTNEATWCVERNDEPDVDPRCNDEPITSLSFQDTENVQFVCNATIELSITITGETPGGTTVVATSSVGGTCGQCEPQ